MTEDESNDTSIPPSLLLIMKLSSTQLPTATQVGALVRLRCLRHTSILSPRPRERSVFVKDFLERRMSCSGWRRKKTTCCQSLRPFGRVLMLADAVQSVQLNYLPAVSAYQLT